MRTLPLLALALVACRKDPADFKPDPEPVDDTGFVDDTGDTDGETGDTSGTFDDTGDTEPVADADADGFTVEQGDCDDADPAVRPGAEEICDGLDQDCDGVADEGVTGTFWADADGDGFGDPETSTEACEGAADNDDDCDDTRPDVAPGAFEACDGADNDCDDAIDEEGLTYWYTDADGDGYGDVGTGELDCAAEGRVSDRTDCDDADAATFPGAEEVCNGADDDCDGTSDEGVTGTWYIDYDGDGHGSSRYTRSGCSAPAGYVASDDDCDDTDELVSPSGTEVCNATDDDCDGTVDEDDAVDAPTWYYDGDADGWGDAVLSAIACEAPADYVEPVGDCDDTDATVYPGASERYDGVDDDCDGTVDDNTWVGTGADGALVVSGTTDLSEDGSGGRSFPDGVTYAVTGLGSDTVTLADDADGIAAGDEVLIVNLQGSGTAHGSVGAYEFAWVASVSGDTVTLDAPVTGTYGEVSNADLSDQAVVLVRVPQYTDVTVTGTGLLTAASWDGASGGVLAFRATGTVTVAAGGAIAMDEAGYAGGSTGTAYNNDSFQGESYAGRGCGDAPGSASYNQSNGCYVNNFGGGGAHVTGGGGAYGPGATAGASWTGGSASPPQAGDAYGEVDLSRLFLGSGGGGVWYGGSDPGPGGGGGGIVFVGASAIALDGAAAISATGGTTTHWATGTWTYGAGGGAGGSIWLVADTLTAASGAIDAQGGLGEDTHIRIGGDGGVGRVRVDCVTVNGAACSTAALAAGAEPDPGYVSTP